MVIQVWKFSHFYFLPSVFNILSVTNLCDIQMYFPPFSHHHNLSLISYSLDIFKDLWPLSYQTQTSESGVQNVQNLACFLIYIIFPT